MDAPTPYDLLKLDLEVAMDLAAAGRVRDGYHILDGGLATAEAPPHEPWSEDLALRYRQAMVLYAQAHGLWFALPPDADEITPPSRAELLDRTLRQARESCQAQQAARATAAEARSRAVRVREESRQLREQAAEARTRWPSRRLEVLLPPRDQRPR